MKSALECNPQRFCEFWFLIWITTWPTVMEVASCKNRQNTKENAKIWQFLLKATKLVSLNWKMTPNYSVYFGLMGKRFLSEKCCGLYWNEGCSLDLGSKNSGYIGMRVLLECGFNWKKYGIHLPFWRENSNFCFTFCFFKVKIFAYPSSSLRLLIFYVFNEKFPWTPSFLFCFVLFPNHWK